MKLLLSSLSFFLLSVSLLNAQVLAVTAEKLQTTSSSEQAVLKPKLDWNKVVSLKGNDLINYVSSLALEGQQSLNFWKQLPLSHANIQIAQIFNREAFSIYMRRYPRLQPETISFVRNMGTLIKGPISGQSLKLPFPSYHLLPEGVFGDPNKTYRIGYSIHGLTHPWLLNNADSAMWQAEQFSNVELTILDPHFDNNKQAKQIDNWIEQKYDGILVWPMQEGPSGPPIDRAVEAGIPVVSVDRLVGSAQITSQVTGNFPANGAQQAMYLIDRLYKEYGEVKGNVLLIRKPLGSTADAMRTGHFLKALSYFPKINIISSYHNSSNRNDSKTQVAAALKKHTEIDVVFCTGAEQAMGAVAAIDNANRWNSRTDNKRIIVLSNDDLYESLEAIKENKIAMVSPYTPLLGALGVRVLLQYIETGKRTKNITTPDLPMITLNSQSIFGLKTMSVEQWQPYAYGKK
jgi:ribose transport system substrate-binding protein